MNKQTCKHPKAHVVSRDEGYRPIAARNPDPRAHGCITEIETCKQCGAVRLTNRNGSWTETTGWR